MVISQGRVVVDHGKARASLSHCLHVRASSSLCACACVCSQVDVVRGCGRYIPRAPYAELVYSRTLQRDRVCVPQAVDREPYSGPVIQLPPQ